MVIATFGPTTGWAGRTITYDDGRLILTGHGEILAAHVVDYDRQGHLVWPYGEMRAWVYSLAGPRADDPRERLLGAIAAATKAGEKAEAVRQLAEVSDGQDADLVLGLLDDRWATVRSAAADALGQWRVVAAVGPLTVLLGDPQVSAQRSAAVALANIGTPEALRSLESLPVGAGSRTIVLAVEALARAGASSALPKLLELLRSEDPVSRDHAVRLLGAMDVQPAVDAVLAALRDDQAGSVRAAAAQALQYRRPDLLWPMLPRLIDDPEPDVVLVAVETLGDAGDAAAVAQLERLIKHPSADVRLAVVQAVASSDDAEMAVRILRTAARDKDAGVREAVREGLEDLIDEC